MNAQPRGITALRRARPTDHIIAELRAAAHRDIDAIFDALPVMIDQADAPHQTRPHGQPVDHNPDDQRADPDAIKAKGGRPSDPTGSAATKPNPARDWIRTMRNVTATAHTLHAKIETIIGPAICPECEEPLAGRPVKRLRGIAYHDGSCRAKAYRAQQAA